MTEQDPRRYLERSVVLATRRDVQAAVARMAAEINQSAENIGARRLHTVLERLLEELSFDAPDRAGEAVEVTAEMVKERLSELIGDRDLARYIL